MFEELQLPGWITEGLARIGEQLDEFEPAEDLVKELLDRIGAHRRHRVHFLLEVATLLDRASEDEAATRWRDAALESARELTPSADLASAALAIRARCACASARADEEAALDRCLALLEEADGVATSTHLAADPG